MQVSLTLITSFLTNLVLTKASTATLRTQFRCCFSTPKEASGRLRLVINWQLARFAFRTWSSGFNHWFLRINHFKNLTAGKVMHIVEVVSKNHIKLFVFVKISIPSFTVSAVVNEAYLFTQVSNIWMRFLTRAPWTAPLLVALLQQTNTWGYALLYNRWARIGRKE